MSTKMIPQLRFPEFTDEWQVKKLGDTVKFEQGVQVDLPQQKPTPFEDSVKFLRIENYTQKSQDFRYISKKIAGKKYINDDEVAVVRYGATAGFIATGQSGVLANNLFSVRSNGDSISNKFLSLRLKQPRTYSYFQSEMSGGAMPALSFSIVSRYKFAFPSKPEQEKIADFLTAVDERIAVGEKKLELLETYKRGVMQKIFTQQIRFKDENGSSYPDWEEKKLGEVFNCVKGTGLSREQITDTGLNKCILYGELYTKYGEVIENVISRTNSNAGISSKSNDLLLPCSTTTTGIDLANATALNEADVQLGGDISVLRFKKSGSNIFYAYYLSHFMKQKLASYGQGSTIVHMYFSHFKNMIVVEPSIEEQQKIANFLTTLDNKIKLEEARLASVKEFKKALLQRMFV